jgi:SAM-dependent methyltransferase
MEFTGQIATIQQRLAACHEMAARRHAVLQELAPRRGERVIEVGCGAGLLLRDIGLALGPHGLAAGVDVSADQIAAAARECAEVPAVKPMVCDIRALDYPDAVFDAAVAVQVVEYIEDALPPMLARAGFGNIRTLPVPIVNPDLHENTFAWWIARLMATYAVERGVSKARAEEWLTALDAAEAAGEFFFSSVPILTTALAT